MLHFLPYFFGIPFFLGGLYLFLLSFRLYTPKHKNEEQEAQHRKWLEKYGTLMKICSIALLLNGSYDLIMRDPERYSIGNGSSNTEWTPQYRATFIKNCIKDAGQTAATHPQITKEYCICSLNSITTAMTKDQYVKSLAKTQEEQLKEILPIIQGCLNELKQRIDSVNKQTK